MSLCFLSVESKSPFYYKQMLLLSQDQTIASLKETQLTQITASKTLFFVSVAQKLHISDCLTNHRIYFTSQSCISSIPPFRQNMRPT